MYNIIPYITQPTRFFGFFVAHIGCWFIGCSLCWIRLLDFLLKVKFPGKLRLRFLCLPNNPPHTQKKTIKMKMHDNESQTLHKTNIEPEDSGWETTFLLGRPIFRAYYVYRPATHLYTFTKPLSPFYFDHCAEQLSAKKQSS